MEKPSKTILIHYFAGTLPEQEKTAIEDYIAFGDDPAFIQECMEAAWQQTMPADIHYLPDQQAWQTFHARMHTPMRRNLRRISIAASIITLLGISIAFFPLRQRPAPLAWTTITGTPMLVKKVQLPDGSNITLFPGAAIRYSTAYNSHERTILLEGRAFFEVAPAAGKPFSVKTGDYTTQVLGTSFEIREERMAQQLSVILQSGKVQVLKEEERIGDLHPGEQLQVHTGNGEFAVNKVAADAATAWTNGELNYEQTAFETTCRELEGWYGVKINVHRPALLKKRITASFHRQSLKVVLDILSQTAGFSWHQQQQQIDIY